MAPTVMKYLIRLGIKVGMDDLQIGALQTQTTARCSIARAKW